MKKLLIYIMLVSIIISCKNKKQEDACCKKPETSTDEKKFNTDITLYDIETIWTNQENNKMSLSDFKQKKAIVLAMIFTNCKAACPRITADLQRIEKEIPKDELDNVAFVLVTMDPDRDTPEQLKEFAGIHQLDLKRWTLLTATPSEVLEFANVLNVRINKTEDGNFDHSNIIHIINSNGNIVHQQIGLDINPTESIDIIKSILSK